MQQFFLEFDDHGFFQTSQSLEVWDAEQLDAIIGAIEGVRSRGEAPIVLLFVHGWQNSADDGNEYVKSFRYDLLLPFAATSDVSARPVIAIYVGWSGRSTIIPVLKWLNFFARYNTVSRIASGSDFQYSLRRIAAVTKDGPSDSRGLFLVVGHSMGSMMLQESMLSILISESIFGGEGLSGGSRSNSTEVVESAVPDLAVFMNSAAYSLQMLKLVKHLDRHPANLPLGKSNGCTFRQPLVVSLASEVDGVTKNTFAHSRLIELYRGDRQSDLVMKPFPHYQNYYWWQTDGNNKDLLTHVVEVGDDCGADPAVSIRSGELQVLRFESEGTVLCLKRLASARAEMRSIWIVRVPKEVSAKHGDVFNQNTRALFGVLVKLRQGQLAHDVVCED